MSNYIVTTDFAAKDALPSGNPAKVAQGTQIDAELDNIATAVATKEDAANKGVSSGYCGLDGSARVAATNMPAHTGDVTSTAGTVALTIPNDTVTNAKAANMAANTFKGRITASTGDPEDITAANAVTILLTADGAGSLLDADKLDGQEGAFYQSASNLNAGIIPDARIQASGVTQHQASLAITAPQITTTVSTQTGSFSVASTDAEDIVICNSASTITVTVGSNCLGAAGMTAVFIRRGAGAVTFSAGGGVTINSPASGVSINQQHGKAALTQITTTVFELSGNV